ncbi:MAG: hypothetical protein Q9M40_10840 [Sulfurimonas sp.]|nr:hypothetical protein [Sulfurimonas sp.]
MGITATGENTALTSTQTNTTDGNPNGVLGKDDFFTTTACAVTVPRSDISN